LGVAAILEKIDCQSAIELGSLKKGNIANQTAIAPITTTAPISSTRPKWLRTCFGAAETADTGGGVLAACTSGFPHSMQNRSPGLTLPPHFGQLEILRGGIGGGTDPVPGCVFGPPPGAGKSDAAPISHNTAPTTIIAMLRAGLPPPNKLKIRNCMPSEGRISDAPPITTSTAPHCWSLLFMIRSD
jgi:hypothetical protein